MGKCFAMDRRTSHRGMMGDRSIRQREHDGIQGLLIKARRWI